MNWTSRGIAFDVWERMIQALQAVANYETSFMEQDEGSETDEEEMSQWTLVAVYIYFWENKLPYNVLKCG